VETSGIRCCNLRGDLYSKPVTILKSEVGITVAGNRHGVLGVVARTEVSIIQGFSFVGGGAGISRSVLQAVGVDNVNSASDNEPHSGDDR
jgi:hypothetical protein